MLMKRWCCLFVLGALALGCSDDPTDPDGGVPEGELVFMRFASTNAVTTRQASFWAKRGEDRRLEIDYADGEEFLEFEVRDESLLRRPDGTVFQNGDSILITVTLDNSDRIILDFQPSGLVFNPLEPAQLEINYQQNDPDIDDDGDHDDDDLDLEAAMRIWQREQAGAPWLPLATVRIDEDDLRAGVLSFTGFAMASN
jgi:hypothetical protein